MMDCYNDIYMDIKEEEQVMDFSGLEPYKKLVFCFDNNYIYLLKEKRENFPYQIEITVPEPDEDDDDYYVDINETVLNIFKNRGIVGRTINFCILKNKPYLAFHMFPPKDAKYEEELFNRYKKGL